MAWNMSAAKRRALVKLQLRDKNGRFVEMGKGVKWFSSALGKEVTGEVVDGEGTKAVVRLSKESGGQLVKVPAKNIEIVEAKASLPAKGEPKPESQSYSKMTDQDKIAAAEKMYGTGSEQHKKAIEKFGQDADNTPDTTTSPLTVTKTSDGNTYITASEGAQLYTPAKELAVGDEVIAPDGADPMKPFSMGKAWATKNAERVNTQGVKIGKVISIKEHAYAVVQLPEGEMIPHVKTGEPQNSVTIGLSNKVIKATPELKEQLKDVIPEPTYTAPEATDADAEKKAKRLSMLKISPAGTLVKSKSGEDVVFNKFGDNDWGKNDGSTGYTDEDVVSHISNNEETGWLVEQDTNTGLSNEKPSDTSVTDEELHSLVGESFQASLSAEVNIESSYFGKDETFGDFEGFNNTEAYSIEQYVGGSNYINGSLRAGKVEEAQLARQILGIDNIMAKSVMAEDATVYRGLTANQAILDGLLNKGVLHDHAFTSTSQDANKANEWVENSGGMGTFPVVMEIALPKGFTAHKIDYSLVGEAFSPEAEVLLPRNLDFDIQSVEEYTTPAGHKGYRVKATPILTEKNFKTGENNGTEGNTGDSNNGDAGSSTDSSAGNEAGTGTDSGQSGEIRDDSGTGNVPESGGSSGEENPESEDQDSDGPLDPQYEALAKQIAELKAEITGAKEESPAPRTPRDRQTIMDELAPVDISNWKKVGPQAGSNPGGVFEDENGQKWYVKQSKSEDHARAEVLASQLYTAAGVGSPPQKLTSFEGKMGTASPMIDGAKSDLGSKYSDKEYMDKVKEGFAVDAWLANWDVVGLGDDNIVTDSEGNPARIDTGGTMMFRAQGGIKNDSQPGAWGPEVKDWDGLRTKGEAQKAFNDISDQQMVDSAARVEAVSPEEIDAMVDALGWTGPSADELKTTLKARREDIISKAKALGVEPSQKEEASPVEAPEGAPTDEPFEPVLPSAQKAAQPVYTKENPKVLSGYTIKQDDRGVNYPEERLSIEDWNGLRNGTVVPESFPFIPFQTTSGEVHYWDSEGNRHWGQYGGAGALMRRKKANGEYEYLLAQRASTLSTAPGMWTTPGGAHYNLEESKAKGATAKIELAEELGIDLAEEPIAEYKHSTVPDWSYDYSIFDSPEGMEMDPESVDKREIQDIEWYTAEEIRGLREHGELHPAMSEVLDNLLDASESVEGPSTAPETSNEDSNAPETLSPAAEAPSLVEPDAPAAEVKTNGPSVSMADGNPAYEGSKITHAKFGTGIVLKIIAGKSAKIEFDDGTVKIAQAHKISSFDGEPVLDAPVDTTGMAPGEYGNNPSNGKLFIVGANGQAMYQGDKVSASHKGEEKSGVIKGIYKSTNSVAIIFDGEEKPVTKKASLTSSLEKISTPDEPTPSDPNSVDADGYTAEERKVVDALEAKVALVYQGAEEGDVEELEKALDYLYAKADSRINGEPEPEDHDGVEERLKSDDPVAAIEEMSIPEEAPETLVEPDPEPVVEEMTDPEVAVESPEEVVEPEPVVDPAPSPETAESLPAGTVLSIGEGGGTQFTKGAEGIWEMSVDGKPTLVIANKGMIQDMLDNHEVSIKKPELTPEERLKNVLDEVDQLGGFFQKNQQAADALKTLKEKLLAEPDPVKAEESGLTDSNGSPNRNDVNPEDDQWVDEWQAGQDAKKSESKKQFDQIVGDKLGSPTGAVLDTFPPGTQVVGSTNPEYVWTKTPSHSLMDGDPIWKDQNGYEASAFELADGGDFKIVTYGSVPESQPKEETLADWELELLNAGSAQANEAKEFYDSIDDIQTTKNATGAEIEVLPTGSKVIFDDGSKTIWTKQGYTHDLDEGFIWKSENGDEASSLQLATGKDMKTIQFGEAEPDESPETNQEASDKLSPKGFEKHEYKPVDKPNQKILDDISSLPIGTKIPGTFGSYWIKKDIDVWDSGHEGSDKVAGYNYSDEAMAELAESMPSDFPYESAILPDGVQPVKETSKDAPTGTVGGVSKEDFDKLPVGSEIKYSDKSDFSEPTGVYTKKSNGNWDYTPAGATEPGKEVENSKFDHLFEAELFDPSYLVVGSNSGDIPEPKLNTGITKNVHLPNFAAKIPDLLVGTTIKPEIHENYYNKNDTYWVKEGDNLWQEYKKTAKKTMKGQTRNDGQMSYMSSYATISEPLSGDNAVLGTGELVYAGDTVFFGGESYTISKINKTGIKIVNSLGEKSIVKPHGLKKDLDFGKPKVNHGVSYDPVSDGAKKAEAKKEAELAAKVEADKLKQSLENYGGASSDDYDAYGVTMPSNPSPVTENGLSVVEPKEVDPSNKLYGAPKPIQPPSPDAYPAYKPVASQPLPKWDSAAWLKKVEERYEANPNKAKATVQQSAKWSKIQSVLDGNKEYLSDLLNSMYLDEDMKKEASEGIDAQEKFNAPLKEKMLEEAKAHKDEYDATKAKALAEAEVAMTEYQKNLEAWIEANPSGDHYKKAQKPAVSKEAFTGGEADWSKAHVGTHTAKTIMNSMKDDNVLGTHGLSFAVDSDQIDDLDVKVTKVLDAAGEEKFEFKFRLTSPHGKAFALGLKNDDKVTKTDGIYPQRMVLDKETGLMKDNGKPTSHSFVKNGARYVYADQMTGAKIVFQKSSYEDGINITDLDNTVKIHMPMDATPEMFQQTLENMGIKKARPSTAGDIMVLAENKLIAMMGEELNGLKPYSQKANFTGEDRVKVLAKIKEDFGVTPADMTFSTEPNGRVKFFLSDEKAKQFAKDYGVSHFKHGVSNDSEVDTWIGMLAGPTPGLLSTYHRFTEGIGGEGMSSSEDLGVGSADGVYVSPHPPQVNPTGYTGIVIKPSSIFKRMDFWANPSDSYGKKGDGTGGGGSTKTPHQLWKKTGQVYEVTPKDSIPISDWAFAILPSSVREKVIKALKEKGIFQINGMPLEEFLITSGGTPPVDLTTPGTV